MDRENGHNIEMSQTSPEEPFTLNSAYKCRVNGKHLENFARKIGFGEIEGLRLSQAIETIIGRTFHKSGILPSKNQGKVRSKK
jgi:hypothetical protein